jgi:hypothetical protein
MKRKVNVSMLVDFESHCDKDKIQRALIKGIIRGLDTAGSYIAKPKDVNIVFTGTRFESLMYRSVEVLDVLKGYAIAEQARIYKEALDTMSTFDGDTKYSKYHCIAMAMGMTYKIDKDSYYFKEE